MAIETAADLDAFFDEEGFGEAAVYIFDGISFDIVVIRHAGTTDLRTGDSYIPVAELTFDMRADVVTPETGAQLQVGFRDLADGTFVATEYHLISGAPRLTGSGAIWTVEVAPN